MLIRSDATLAEANIKAGSAIRASIPLVGGVDTDKLPANTVRIYAVAKGNEDEILYREDFKVNYRTTICRELVADFIRNIPEEH